MSEIFHELGVDIHSDWSFKNGDLELIKYDDNLLQSIINRLNCTLGALDIFYEYYGSNLYEYLGWKNDDTTLEYIKIEIDDVLKQDPRLINFSTTVQSSYKGVCKCELEITFNEGQTFVSNLIILYDGSVQLLTDSNLSSVNDKELSDYNGIG